MIVGLFLASQALLAQGPQGSFSSRGGMGGGGMGGGQQGGQQGDYEQSAKVFPPKGEMKQYGFWGMKPKGLILTPGDRVEYEVTLKAGQSLLASAESISFDPAIEIEDENKKVVKENDDQYPGEQTPFVSFFSEKGGVYKIIVKNYRSTSGGSFVLYTKTVDSYTLKSGLNEIYRPGDNNYGSVIHVVAKKGDKHCIDLKDFNLIGADRSNEVSILTPNGLIAEEIKKYDAGLSNKSVFEALAEGDYYFLVQPSATFYQRLQSSNYKPQMSLGNLKVIDFNLDGSSAERIEKGDALVYKAEVKPRDLWMTKIEKVGQSWSWFDAPRPSDQLPITRPQRMSESERSNFLYASTESRNVDAGGRIFYGKGTCFLTFVNLEEKAVDVKVTNSTKIPIFDPKEKVKKNLGLGQSHFYSVSQSDFDDFSMQLKADGFEPTIQLIDEYMGTQQVFDFVNQTPKTWFYSGNSRNFIAIVSSLGGGGRGSYELSGEVVAVANVKPNQTVQVGKQPTGIAKYLLKADADQSIVLTMSGEGKLTMTDSKGRSIIGPSLSVDGLTMYYFKVKKDDVIRIRLSGSKLEDVKFKITNYKLDPPVRE